MAPVKPSGSRFAAMMPTMLACMRSTLIVVWARRRSFTA